MSASAGAEATLGDPGGGEPTPPVTVAVVSWNTRELLRRCLASLEADARAGRADVWVFDNASSDGSADLVAAEFGWVTLVASNENLGFGRAVNAVVQQSGGEWIAASNADVELGPGALEALLAAGRADASLGAVAPRLLLDDSSTQHSVHPFPGVRVSVVLGLGLPRLDRAIGDRLCLEGFWDPERPRSVDWAHGAFLLVRRSAFEGVGGFDARQWMYAEDLDLGWRLARGGWRTRYEPAAAIRHVGAAATSQAFGEARAMRHMEAAYAWMARRRGVALARAHAAVNIALIAPKLAVATALSRASPRRFARAAAFHRHWARMHAIGLRPRRRLLGG